MKNLRGANWYARGAFIGNVGISCLFVFFMFGLFMWVLGLFLPETVATIGGLGVAAFIGFKEFNISMSGPYMIRDVKSAEDEMDEEPMLRGVYFVIGQYILFYIAEVAGLVFRILTTPNLDQAKGIAAFTVLCIIALLPSVAGFVLYRQDMRSTQVMKKDFSRERETKILEIEHKAAMKEIKSGAKKRNVIALEEESIDAEFTEA